MCIYKYIYIYTYNFFSFMIFSFAENMKQSRTLMSSCIYICMRACACRFKLS